MDKNMFVLLVDEVKRRDPNLELRYNEALSCVYIKGIKTYIKYTLGMNRIEILSFYEVINNEQEFLGSIMHGMSGELRLVNANHMTVETVGTDFKSLVDIVEKLKVEKTVIENKEKTLQKKYEEFMEGVIFEG